MVTVHGSKQNEPLMNRSFSNSVTLQPSEAKQSTKTPCLRSAAAESTEKTVVWFVVSLCRCGFTCNRSQEKKN